MDRGSDAMIRLVRPADAAMLQANCFAMNTVEEVAERISGHLRVYDSGECLPLVAEVDGVVVGTAVLLRDAHGLRRHRATVGGVVVCQRYVRRGIARQLVGALRDQAAGMGVEILEISVRAGTPAEEVYRRLGFQEYGRLPRGLVEPWGERGTYDEVYLWMPVAPAGGSAGRDAA